VRKPKPSQRPAYWPTPFGPAVKKRERGTKAMRKRDARLREIYRPLIYSEMLAQTARLHALARKKMDPEARRRGRNRRRNKRQAFAMLR